MDQQAPQYSIVIILRRSVVKAIGRIHTPYPYLTGMIFSVTRNVANTAVVHKPRQHGQSNYNLKKLISLAFNLLIHLITVAPKKWESAFFNRSFATLEIDSSLLSASNWDALNPFFQKLLQQADRQEIALIELSLGSRGFGLIPTLEAAGFRLVDSKMTFLTMINRHQVIRFDPAVGRLALATPDDLPAMLELTKNCFVHNPSFFSRFKHPDYFSVRESERYYCAWITNHLDDPKSLMGVFHHGEAVQGYFFIGKKRSMRHYPFT